ncbi:hypothetical protein CEP54_007924 [Fusarium duplospermum]|uniref:Uncharacterized protein n=1 Tax=Fusarium duplospermum TaxID=1325734 RepID=A0A428PYS8_9HYPO|nr:hypothetical protein CEP54_007924 [Fusarium duplospermum]
MSQIDYDQRLGRLENSRLTSVVLDSARRSLAATTITDEDGDTAGESHSMVDENKLVPPCRRRATRRTARASGGPHRDLDEDNQDPDDDADDDIPHVETAKAFMQLIFDNPMSEYRNL